MKMKSNCWCTHSLMKHLMDSFLDPRNHKDFLKNRAPVIIFTYRYSSSIFDLKIDQSSDSAFSLLIVSKQAQTFYFES